MPPKQQRDRPNSLEKNGKKAADPPKTAEEGHKEPDATQQAQSLKTKKGIPSHGRG